MDNQNNKIKQVFDNWDNTFNDIAYDKQKVWADITKKKTVIIPLFFRVAVVVLILLLSGNLFVSVCKNRVEQDAYKEQIAILKQELNKKPKKEIETKYETKIKKVFINSPEQQKEITVLQQQIKSLQKQNIQLNNNLENLSAQNDILNDSVKYWNKAIEDLHVFYKQELTALKQQYNSELIFNVDSNAIAALNKEENKNENKPQSKPKSFFKLKFNNNNYTSDSESDSYIPKYLIRF